MLAAQATALQTLFARLTERAMEQTTMPNIEGFMRLALRAQSQCRATLETLASIKNPPMIYAKQINQTTGPQQINNAVVSPSQARQIENTPNKLLEGDNGKWLDAGTTGTTSGVDSEMAPVGAVDGAAD